MKRCISCRAELKSTPLFTLENMPKGAQIIPDASELDSDSGVTVKLFACDCCGLVQLSNEPVPYYRDVIRAVGYSEDMVRMRNEQFKEFIELCGLNGKKIIEVGCGRGEYLKVLSEFPVKAYGTENNSEFAQTAVNNGLNVQCIFPENENTVFENAPFDAFTSLNFLEHQPNPRAYLKAIAANLADGGYGLINVPSLDYVLSEKNYFEIIPDHISYFSMSTLCSLLESCCFDIIKKSVVNNDTLAVIVRKKLPPDITPLLSKKTVIENDIYTLLAFAEKAHRTVSIWGASHQSFTVCSTVGLGESVKYIIDSAPFKQGRFSPVSHIPIISPEKAMKAPTDIIIIIAPSYSKEITRIIKANFSNNPIIYSFDSDGLSKQ